MENNGYSGALTREQFLFYEIRTVATLMLQGLDEKEIRERVLQENLFQFPTEKAVRSIARTCFRRIQILDSETLLYNLANAPADVARQINLYAMMKDNRFVWDFMTRVIGEKYRTQDFELTRRDMNAFISELQEQVESVAKLSDATVLKIKQVLIHLSVECGYLDSFKATQLNYVMIAPELEDGIVEKNDLAALPAFNCFR